MSGNPSDRSVYEIGVLREKDGRGGSHLLQRIFSEDRKIFISRPINHFPLSAEASYTFLMGGGIGITPMMAMAHELHSAGEQFELHYSGRSREQMGYLDELASFSWARQVQLHISDEGTHCDVDKVLKRYQKGWHVYTCGAERYMNSVVSAAEAAGFPEDAWHLEYFSVPEQPDYVNTDFELKLLRSGTRFHVPAEKSATDVLLENGIKIDVKCSDGLCGVCKCALVSGEVEHRDFVLSKSQQKDSIILCQSRAAEAGGVLEIDL